MGQRIRQQQDEHTTYLDESATNSGDPNAPIAVVGGLTLNRSGFKKLDANWDCIMDKYQLREGIHPRTLTKDRRMDKRDILLDIVQAINEVNIYTLGFYLRHEVYLRVFPDTIQKLTSQYTLCFTGCVVQNHLIAQNYGFVKPVSLILDEGNQKYSQVVDSHEGIVERQADTGKNLNVGNLSFANDEDISALQAADVISWTVRRHISGAAFNDTYTPLLEILKQRGHNQDEMTGASCIEILNRLKSKFPQAFAP